MVESWNVPHPDPDRICSFFAENISYHNIPLEPVIGLAAYRAGTVEFLDRLDGVHWEIHHQVASGNLVMNERTDTLQIGGRVTPVPVMGVFEVMDGLITKWRDYFDLAELDRALGV
ncbi:MAG TPA: limonene-1,2-epoxide hydrolase family protein [Actinomycetota bacterium]|nr:limonene-1,2-epoxide hydrolase family protein [Actinomycetota bacterium]